MFHLTAVKSYSLVTDLDQYNRWVESEAKSGIRRFHLTLRQHSVSLAAVITAL